MGRGALRVGRMFKDIYAPTYIWSGGGSCTVLGCEQLRGDTRQGQ